MKYLIIGAGGTGGCLGGYLGAAGHDVTFIARGAQLEAIRANGFTLHDGGADLRPAVKARAAADYAGSPDVILICVKGYALDEIIPLLARCARPDTLVVPILNGIGAGARIAEKLPDTIVLEGCIYVAAYISAPGEVTKNGKLLRVVFGEREGNAHAAALDALAAELQAANISAVHSADIGRDAFRKYMLISPMAAAGAYYDVGAGRLTEPGEPRETFTELVRELGRMADARGYRYPVDMVEDGIRRMELMGPDATSSMQRDLKRGGASELDALVFEPVRLAERLGVPAPAYRKIASRFGYRG